MQRVRIGLTGLAFVFVLVLLGAVFSRASEEEPITPNLIEQQMAGAPIANAQDEPKEPLAELGVTPGAVDSNASQKAENAIASPAGQ